MPQTRSSPSSAIKSGCRITALLLWSIFMTLIFGGCALLFRHKLHQIPPFFHRGCCRILGIKLRIEGELTDKCPALFVSNHISYLDIFILGGILPGAFISKADVAGWPLLGQMARMQNTLFIERSRRHAISQIGQMQKRLQNDQNLILFPEGTSTSGVDVAPFKSTLFKAAEITTSVAIQPVCINYLHSKGEKLEGTLRDAFAWYADMTFLKHFLYMAGMSGLQVKITLLESVTFNEFGNRKLCAEYCHAMVSQTLTQNAIPQEPPPAQPFQQQ